MGFCSVEVLELWRSSKAHTVSGTIVPGGLGDVDGPGVPILVPPFGAGIEPG